MELLWDHIFPSIPQSVKLTGTIVLQFLFFANLVKFGQQIKPNNKKVCCGFLIHIWIYMTSYLCVVIYTELLKPQEQDLFGKDLNFSPSLLDKLIKTTQIWLFFRLLQSL